MPVVMKVMLTGVGGRQISAKIYRCDSESDNTSVNDSHNVQEMGEVADRPPNNVQSVPLRVGNKYDI